MRCLLVCLICYATVSCTPTQTFGDDIEIELGADSVRDPLLLFRFPEAPSPDVMRFTTKGLLVDQPTSKDEREPDVIGLKLACSTRGDFTFTLDVDCLKLTQPKGGWGHGVVTKFIFADKDQPQVAFGCIATPRFEKAYRITVESGNDKPTFKTEPCEFASGQWEVVRSGNELIFSVEEKGERSEVHRVAYSPNELLEIQIWANRLPKDNGDARFLLKKVSLVGDEFFARSEVTRARFGLWTPFLIASATTAFLLFFYVLRRRK